MKKYNKSEFSKVQETRLKKLKSIVFYKLVKICKKLNSIILELKKKD